MPRIYSVSEYVEAYQEGYQDGLKAARRDIGPDFGTDRPRKAVKRRKSNPWVIHLKRFKFRKKRKNESGQDYLVARTKAAKRKYKKKKGKK